MDMIVGMNQVMMMSYKMTKMRKAQLAQLIKKSLKMKQKI
jgi:hypothetical protein